MLLDIDDFLPRESSLPQKRGSSVGKRLSLTPDAQGMYGLDVPQRLLWEACVMRWDITRTGELVTGRVSEPAFMDLNLKALRDGSSPSAALWQDDVEDALNPLRLLMAHEEDVHGVRPVASDLDAFLIGSKGMDPGPPIADDQVDLSRWLLSKMDEVLSTPSRQGWTKRWLEVVKAAATQGFHPTMPAFGYGDPTTYDIIANIVDATSNSGAVRHGPECFNYYFPQAMDETYLVVWEGFTHFYGRRHTPWQYVSADGLREFLLARVDDGYSFPLNPKWVVCDPGWAEVFDKLCRAPHAKGQLATWLPPHSGLREKLGDLVRQHPNGFRPAVERDEDIEIIDQDVADWELHRHIVFRRAKLKLRALHRMGAFRYVRPDASPAPVRQTDD